jgi:hypothetical protein
MLIGTTPWFDPEKWQKEIFAPLPAVCKAGLTPARLLFTFLSICRPLFLSAIILADWRTSLSSQRLWQAIISYCYSLLEARPIKWNGLLMTYESPLYADWRQRKETIHKAY